MNIVEVFADVACPFTHAGLCRFRAYRQVRGRTEPVLRVRAWPLELVNGAPLSGPSLTPKIAGLRASVAADLFAGFDEHRFPATTLPAMAAEAAAYRRSVPVGERFSFAIRAALFEEGLDVSDPDVLRVLRDEHDVPEPTDADHAAVNHDLAEGRRRGVTGSPHFFTAGGDFFCPSINIEHDGEGYEVTFDSAGFQRFVAAAFD
jgi:predicted DsbA family dithiol-disulfide isomerase